MASEPSSFDRRVDIRIGSSRMLVLLVVAIHLSALWVVALTDTTGWIKAAMMLMWFVSIWTCLDLVGLRRFVTVTALSMLTDGSFEITTATRTEPAQLERCNIIGPLLTLLVLRSTVGHCYRVILTRDNVAPEPFRQLRARLLLRDAISRGNTATPVDEP